MVWALRFINLDQLSILSLCLCVNENVISQCLVLAIMLSLTITISFCRDGFYPHVTICKSKPFLPKVTFFGYSIPPPKKEKQLI